MGSARLTQSQFSNPYSSMMPPKKRARTTATATASPAPSLAPSLSADATPLHILKRSYVTSRPATPSSFPASATDPWTTAQETALFKALIRYKPTGIHKHFHMLCISSFLRSHGHTLLPRPDGQQQERLVSHTRIVGIWEKLSALFDLETLDEREDQHALAIARAREQEDAQEEADVDDSSEEWVKEFALPESDGIVRRGISSDDEEDEEEATFSDMMWQRRFATDDLDIPSSPPALSIFRGRNGIVEDSRISASPAPTAESARTRKRASRGGAAIAQSATANRRQSTLQAAGRASRRSSRFDSETKSSPAPTQGEDEELSDEEEEGTEVAEEEDEEQEGEEKSTKVNKARAGAGSRRGRSGRGRGGSTTASRGRKR